MTTTWFITGTSSGLGREMTEQLLARGDRVAATLRTLSVLDDLKAQYGDQLWIAALDISDPDAVRRVVNAAFAELGRVDVVVNNAGYALFGAAEEVSDEQIRQQTDTNILGSVAVIRAVLPHLRDQGGGRILQISSEGGQIAYPNFSLYHASKWALEGFVESVAQEVAPFNIEFTLIEPGPTQTNFVGGMVSPPPMDVYDQTPAGEVRRGLASGSFGVLGDPVKVVRAMIASTDQHPAPRRLTLGKNAYTQIQAALRTRLAELENQQDIAFSTDPTN